MNYTVPTCAACRLPISAAAKFLLVGTEVLHKACARADGHETVLWQSRRQEARYAVELAESHRRIQNLTVERDAFAAQERAAHKRLFDADAQYTRSAQRYEEESSRLRSDLIAAQDELARLRARAPVATQAAEDTPGDRVDDTVQRFALLELE